MFEPVKDVFSARYDAGEPQVVYTRLLADLETPVSAMLKLSAARENCFLLESVEGGAARARYSIIGLDPDVVFRAHGDRAEINVQALTKAEAFTPCPEPTLDALRAFVTSSTLQLPEGLPPMAAGVFGYLGYDTVRLIENLPNINPDPIAVPDAIMIRPTVVLIFDSVKDEIIVVTPVRPHTSNTAQKAYAQALERLTSVVDQLDNPLDKMAHELPNDCAIEITSNTPESDYLAMVQKAKDYIAAGDIFQVVLAQRFEAEFTLPPFALYRALRRTNPAPYLFFLKFSGFCVAGSSPEILVRVRDGEVTVRPIAGTRPRGASEVEDRANATDLLADPKECAEHLMLLDLGRNDVGRVAKIGSVKVTDQFFLEYYSHVMHIVSNVTGKLDDARHDVIDALSAGFPAGTVSGAPKVRAMEIIDELEREKRGIYAGCVGYFTADGDMDTCIVLRTAIIKGDRMYVQAGAGIVADSVPQNEYQECVNKAKALFKAAEEAVRFASEARRGQ